VCPISEAFWAPVATDQRRTRLSSLPLAKVVPSGLESEGVDIVGMTVALVSHRADEVAGFGIPACTLVPAAVANRFPLGLTAETMTLAPTMTLVRIRPESGSTNLACS